LVGGDMTPGGFPRTTAIASNLGIDHVEYRAGILEELPVEDGWADVVISNGVLNLVADKHKALTEARRALRSGGWLQFADIAATAEVPDAARCDIDLWTDCIAGSLSVDDWCSVIEGAGFADIAVGLATDTFGGAPGEANARRFGVHGHTFRARAA
jgi:arsenite methyltransferase